METRTTFPHEIEITENLWVPLPDGTRLAAKLWRPKGVAAPVILEYLPYRKREGTRARDHAMHAWLAGHGYACIRLDIRGTGDSEGIITDEYTPQEQEDGVAAIAWLAEQEFCDGQVAMIGISWGGFNGLQIAARQPPALKTIITVGSTDDRYATDIHWVGGCLSKDNFDWSATMLAHNDLPPDPELTGPGWREAWLARAEANSPWILTWLGHQRRDEYWKQGSVCEDISRIEIPVYAVSGWADNYSETVPRLLASLPGPRLGLVGPWAHSFPHDVAVQPAIGWLQEVLRWCDHWLKGRESGIMDEPMYRVWMQESVPPQTCYAERPGRWVGEPSWPSPRIETRSLALLADGSLAEPSPSEAAEAGAKLSICSPLWVGLTAGEVGRYGEDAEWAPDQREDDGGSLVFTTAPLPECTEILGAPQLRLRFSCDKPMALVAVRLNDVMLDGRSTKVTQGYLNLTHRRDHEHAEPLTPGETYEVTVDLDDIAHAFPAGHRIAVSLSTTYWPICWPSPELATLSVETGASWLDLPVRPPVAADAALREFDPPEMAELTPSISHPAEPTVRRTVHRDLLSGEMVVDFPRWTYATEMPDIGQTVTSDAFARYRVTDGDPLSAVTETECNVEIARHDTTCAHHSTGRLSCDATHFRVEVSLRVTENGEKVFERHWDERIPRDHV
ncbi:CocE/NonD family hydrolase [Pseudoroseicyclus tamaricis]|uniref:CocE/NonD family hydrolase n=1 Tax=Pseudoroseicyclus tamaricis TaxID=2705421 RepID=A0A6B2JUB4_9RHOB|nr:CocE/NonD family hydrolase [Pseudoroseicyclus tamaricis]NDV00199.1 CocE/NonD family hydrolase [Pseudoroseicyclus tamaricis]